MPSIRCRDRSKIDIPRSIYFGGAAWGGGFYNGVYKGLVEIWGADFAERSALNVSGDSAGVFWALGIVLGHSPEEVDAIFRRQTARAGESALARRYLLPSSQGWALLRLNVLK